MPTAFDQAFRRVKELVADFRANEKFYLFPAYWEARYAAMEGKVMILRHGFVRCRG
jgi:iron uptake system EfeUOB component EfeO/EfeM